MQGDVILVFVRREEQWLPDWLTFEPALHRRHGALRHNIKIKHKCSINA